MLKLRFLLPLTFLLGITSIFIGVGNVSLSGLLAGRPEDWLLFTQSRLPRLLSILIAGASLSVSGLILQSLSRNRFVSPTTAGLEDSARFGVLLALIMLPAATGWLQTSLAIATTFVGALIFMAILNTLKHRDTVFVPLVGMMFGNIISAITVFFALQFDLLQNINAWLQGDFSSVLSGRYETLFLSVPALIFAYLYAQRFVLAGMGEDFATNLGLNYKRTLNLGLALVSIVTAVVIVTVGSIPFLGLIVPNLVALYLGDNLKLTLPHTAVVGALLVLVCDIIGRVVIYPYEISVSLMMGVIGSAVFLAMLLKRYRHGGI
ncbi:MULTISPECIES: ABC transporter permease [Vitreoscilla]|uniref:Iron chelate uptake ABC transporter family permease subunit n=1 Tax=Vitreoscilla stercoraria TaxID=61 RepID=A0ABY4E892_VITST|nr:MULTISPECIES: iron chelate uptake ABC transporter family permease subunit [Vitreoscilla]QJQ52203.1 FecCD transport family protein [Vitreoscilla sp. C1]UOO91489.1 iron chelate uptake ABC transporter family permease subunit [Vitreoscilla stercoraria]